MVVSIAQARCGLLPPHSFYPLFVLFLKFQSLKRDVAFFHLALFTPTNYTFEVSIAQARCGLLPLTGGHLLAQVSWLFQSLKRDVAFFHATAPAKVRGVAPFQSLKRDVAFFHFVGWIARVVASLVSIAQARCGLLPPKLFL